MVRGFGFGCAVALTAAGLAAGQLAFSAPASAAEPPSAAHSIAQKFAEKPAENPAGKPQAQPKQAQPKQKAAETPVVAPFAKPQTVAETTATPPRPPLDYEMDMLRRARAERAELQKAAPAPNVPKAAAPIGASQDQNAVAPLSAAVGTPAAAAVAAPAPIPQKRVDVPAQPAAAPRSDVSKLGVSKPDVPNPGIQAKAEAPSPATPAVTPAAPPAEPAQAASVLLAIDAESASSTATSGQSHDPIICFGETCFVSAGLSASAIKISKGEALKLKATTDVSPDTCKGKIACVYRDVALDKGALLQLIELGSAANDPSRTYLTEPDASCKVADGVLTCDNPIATPDFRVWIVPEATAKSAGSPAIEEAIAEGLPHKDVARGTDK